MPLRGLRACALSLSPSSLCLLCFSDSLGLPAPPCSALPPTHYQLLPCLAASAASACPHMCCAGVSLPGAGYGWLAGPRLLNGSAALCVSCHPGRLAQVCRGEVASRQRKLRATLLPSRAASRTRKLEGPCQLPCQLLGRCRRLLAPTPAECCCRLLPCWPCWPIPPSCSTRPSRPLDPLAHSAPPSPPSSFCPHLSLPGYPAHVSPRCCCPVVPAAPPPA